MSGYSRYGKAALVAGAFDERIAMTVPGSGGTAGMGNYRFFTSTGSNNETLEDILSAAYWFTPRFAQFRNQSTRLPFDQHAVAALVAPRLLLTINGTEGSDIRTNPLGTSYTYRGAQMVYQYIGARERIGIAYRSGGHPITNLWNGANTGTSGPISVRNAPYNGSIPANGSTTFGYTANGNGAAAPTNVGCTSPN